MTLLLGFMLAITLVMWCVPDSPVGRMLQRTLVEKPLEQLANLKRHHLIYVALLAPMAIAGGELLVLFGPEVLATYAVYLDAVLVSYALAAVAQARGSMRYAGLRWRRGKRVRRLVAARRRRQKHSRRQAPPPANDDEGPFAFPLAA